MPDTLFEIGESMLRSAVISEDGKYRYRLERQWGIGPRAHIMMLNPSVADARIDDPTIRRDIAFARAWGYFGLVVTNAYGYRSTDPKGLKSVDDPVGPDNLRNILQAALECPITVLAWGNNIASEWGLEIRRELRRIGVTPHALRITGLGQPTHPLYLPASLKPFPMEVVR